MIPGRTDIENRQADDAEREALLGQIGLTSTE
jgi:hypothetical protein